MCCMLLPVAAVSVGKSRSPAEKSAGWPQCLAAALSAFPWLFTLSTIVLL